MEAGMTLQWQFAEFLGGLPVHILSVNPNESITFE